MPKAIVIEKPGAASVMKFQEVKVGKPKKGEARIRQTAVGLNYIDVYQRTGLYPWPLPSVVGLEGAGVVEEIGKGNSSAGRRPVLIQFNERARYVVGIEVTAEKTKLAVVDLGANIRA